METQDREVFKIERLNGENYFAWRFRMENFLQKKGYWDVVNGTTVDESKDKKALIEINLSVGDNQIVYVREAKSSRDAWTALEKVYANEGTANKMDLEERLSSKKLKSGASVKEHIEEMKEITAKLMTLGVKKTKEEYAMKLLRSLPKSYESLVVTLENMINSLTIEDIHARILREESRQLAADPEQEGGSMLQAKKGKPFPHKCHYCGKKGHKIRDCWKRQRDEVSKTKGQSKDRHSKGKRSDDGPASTGSFFMAEGKALSTTGTWYLDSGASHHMTNEKRWFVQDSLRDIDEISIKLGNGNTLYASMQGDVQLAFKLYGEWNQVYVRNVLYLPDISANLLAISLIQRNGHDVLFSGNRCTVTKSHNEETVLSIPETSGTYKMVMYAANSTAVGTNYSANNDLFQLWHARLGHLGKTTFQKLISKNIVNGMPPNLQVNSSIVCSGCQEGRMQQRKFKPHNQLYSSDMLDLIHSDVCGPMHVVSRGGSRYFVTFIDDFTRKKFVYFLNTKSEVTEAFRKFKAVVENQKEKKIKRLRTDNGKEYMNLEMSGLLQSEGIIHENSAPYQPQQNGVAERANRTLCEKARCMLYHKDIDRTFWAEAVQTATYIANRLPTAVIGNCSPEQKWSGITPNVSHLRIFGSNAYVMIPNEKRKKWDAKARKCIFLGYQGTNYRFLDEEKKRIVISTNAKFEEGNPSSAVPSYATKEDFYEFDNSSNDQNSSSVQEQHQQETEDVDQICPETGGDTGPETQSYEEPSTPSQQLRRSTRHSTPPERLTYEYASSDEDTAHTAVVMMAETGEPLSFNEANTCKDSDHWKAAMESEMDSLKENGTWDLVPLPQNRKALQPKWVFRLKPETENQQKIYKARLVAKGFQQKYGIDYVETFAPVVRMTSLRTLLAVAVQQRMHIHQMDVKSAFLNGTIDEEVYMHQPEGYIDSRHPEYVCKLNKSLYGLKQAPRLWYKVIDQVFRKLGLAKSKADQAIYCRMSNGNAILVAMYVDDLVLASTCLTLLEQMKDELRRVFKMKDLKHIRHILGIEVHYDLKNGTLRLSQSRHVQELLRKTNMTECKEVSTPMEHGTVLGKVEDEDVLTTVPYRSVVGSLMYLMTATRPDICYAVGLLSRFLERPGQEHWKACKRVLRYLQGTKRMSLIFKLTSNAELVAYSDASWGNEFDKKSVTGYALFFGNCLLSWSSKRQSVVALSTAEAEFIALSESVKEVLWMKKLLGHMVNQELQSTLVNVDNQSAIALARSEGTHGRSKHISIRFMFVQDFVDRGDIHVVYCATDDMKADIFTKALQKTAHVRHTRNLGMQVAQIEGE